MKTVGLDDRQQEGVSSLQLEQLSQLTKHPDYSAPG
jgi:hypothetical protein